MIGCVPSETDTIHTKGQSAPTLHRLKLLTDHLFMLPLTNFNINAGLMASQSNWAKVLCDQNGSPWGGRTRMLSAISDYQRYENGMSLKQGEYGLAPSCEVREQRHPFSTLQKSTYGGSEVPDNSISFAVVARNRVFVGTLKGLA